MQTIVLTQNQINTNTLLKENSYSIKTHFLYAPIIPKLMFLTHY